MTSRFSILTASFIVLTAIVVGCEGYRSTLSNSSTAPSVSTTEEATAAKTPTAASPAASDEHAHKPGTHGGIIVPIGADSYHAEAVVEKSGTLRLMILGKDESRVWEVEDQPLQAYVKLTGDSDAVSIQLAPEPQSGDTKGKTSQFVGQLPAELIGKPLNVTIPNLRIDGERFRVGFTTAAAPHAEPMPASLPADAEKTLYLTAGGKYTAADILANGNITAAQKFRGLMASHDMQPKVGDKICPVTMTKANPKFTWVIDGKSYEFCCPPCVDEFVQLAKDKPDEIKEPGDYVRR